jgi:hypothetical protein
MRVRTLIICSTDEELNAIFRSVYPFTEIGTSPGAKIQQPATLLVLVPGGDESFTVTMPNAPSYVWTANLKQGTQILFDMTDSAGNQGMLWCVLQHPNSPKSKRGCGTSNIFNTIWR